MFLVPIEIAGSLRRVARARMRASRPSAQSGAGAMVVRRFLVGRLREVPFWLGLVASVAAALWLFWPQSLTPDPLLHADAARSFMQTLWQVLAAGLALSLGIVTFSFSAFASSRLFELGAKLSDFARSSGLLIGVAVGLLALLVNGAWLLTLPAESEPHSLLTRTESGGAVAACLLGVIALLLIAHVLRLALKAGDRSWVQQLLRARVRRYLDETVRAEVEDGHARIALNEIVSRFGMRAPHTSRPAGYRALGGGREGVVLDLRLRRLVRLAHSDNGSSQLLLNPMIELFPLGRAITRSSEPLWIKDEAEVSERGARRIFKVRDSEAMASVTNDLDRLDRQGRVAIREDDEPWYREVTTIYREAFLHMIAAWSRYGSVPGDEPFGQEAGLGRCREHLRSQLQEIVAREREEMSRRAVDVPLSAGLAALEHGDEGIRLAYRMEALLEDMALDTLRAGGADTAHAAGGSAVSGLFMLLRMAAEHV
jgi:hypothetical protein